MKIKYKRGGKVWRRDVWLPHWSGGPTPWPRRQDGNALARRTIAMMFAMIGGGRR